MSMPIPFPSIGDQVEGIRQFFLSIWAGDVNRHPSMLNRNARESAHLTILYGPGTSGTVVAKLQVQEQGGGWLDASDALTATIDKAGKAVFVYKGTFDVSELYQADVTSTLPGGVDHSTPPVWNGNIDPTHWSEGLVADLSSLSAGGTALTLTVSFGTPDKNGIYSVSGTIGGGTPGASSNLWLSADGGKNYGQSPQGAFDSSGNATVGAQWNDNNYPAKKGQTLLLYAEDASTGGKSPVLQETIP